MAGLGFTSQVKSQTAGNPSLLTAPRFAGVPEAVSGPMLTARQVEPGRGSYQDNPGVTLNSAAVNSFMSVLLESAVKEADQADTDEALILSTKIHDGLNSIEVEALNYKGAEYQKQHEGLQSKLLEVVNTGLESASPNVRRKAMALSVNRYLEGKKTLGQLNVKETDQAHTDSRQEYERSAFRNLTTPVTIMDPDKWGKAVADAGNSLSAIYLGDPAEGKRQIDAFGAKAIKTTVDTLTTLTGQIYANPDEKITGTQRLQQGGLVINRLNSLVDQAVGMGLGADTTNDINKAIEQAYKARGTFKTADEADRKKKNTEAEDSFYNRYGSAFLANPTPANLAVVSLALRQESVNNPTLTDKAIKLEGQMASYISGKDVSTPEVVRAVAQRYDDLVATPNAIWDVEGLSMQDKATWYTKLKTEGKDEVVKSTDQVMSQLSPLVVRTSGNSQHDKATRAQEQDRLATLKPMVAEQVKGYLKAGKDPSEIVLTVVDNFNKTLKPSEPAEVKSDYNVPVSFTYNPKTKTSSAVTEPIARDIPGLVKQIKSLQALQSQYKDFNEGTKTWQLPLAPLSYDLQVQLDMAVQTLTGQMLLLQSQPAGTSSTSDVAPSYQ